MKAKYVLMTLIASATVLAACHKEKTETRHERNIFYTVSESPLAIGHSANSTTIHLTTDDEWDALLDRFCDYAQEGKQVAFCPDTPAKGKVTANKDTPTSISTTNREEVKAWMKEMEKAGKTVRVSYDETSGTWNGTAYVNLGSHDEQAEEQAYTGELVLTPIPTLEENATAGWVLALQVDADSTLILTVHGMMMLFDGDDPELGLPDGLILSFVGTASTHYDLNGKMFMALELNESENDIVII